MEGSQDDRSSGGQIQPDLCLTLPVGPRCHNAGGAAQRIHPHCGLRLHGKGQPAGDLPDPPVGDEIVTPIRQGPADAHQTGHIKQGFPRHPGPLQSRPQRPNEPASGLPHPATRIREAHLFQKFLKLFPPPVQVAIAGNVPGQPLHKHHRAIPLPPQFNQLRKRPLRHQLARGNHNRPVTAPAQVDPIPARTCARQLAVRYVVKRVAALPQFRCHRAQRLPLEPAPGMDGQVFRHAGRLAPQIVDRPVEKDSPVRLPGLQDRLAPGGVGVQCRNIVPDGVARIHLAARVEQPARPRCLIR